MNPVLIYVDEEKIDFEISVLNNSVISFQTIYNAYKALGVTPTLTEISNLVSWTRSGNGRPNFEQDYAIDKLLAQAGGYIYNGVQLDSTALKSIIAKPDVSAVIAALKQSVSNYNQYVNGTRINLLTLVNDIVGKVVDADAQIEAIYSYYTKTDESAQLATDLQLVANAINAYTAIHPQNVSYQVAFNDSPDSPGLSIKNEVFVPSLKFIRHYEAMKAN